MLPLQIGMGMPASHVDSETLFEFKLAHIKRRCYFLYAFFRNKGLNRPQFNEIRNRFDSYMHDQFDIDQLVDNDEIAKKIRVSAIGFHLPPESQEHVARIANSFFAQEEMKLARNLLDCCPSMFIK